MTYDEHRAAVYKRKLVPSMLV